MISAIGVSIFAIAGAIFAIGCLNITIKGFQSAIRDVIFAIRK